MYNLYAMISTLTPTATLVEQTYQAILNAICQGGLVAGERLTQERIAGLLQVSRQPVGQALTILKTQGFVKESGRRGVVVAHLEPPFFKAIYELRSAIEPMAARLAAPRITEQMRREGDAIIKDGYRAVRTGELQGLVEADARFHTYIYRLSGNPLIGEVMGMYWNHLRRAMGEVLRTKGEGKIVWRQHEEIFHALSAGNGKEASRLAEVHLQSAVVRVLAAVEARTGNGRE